MIRTPKRPELVGSQLVWNHINYSDGYILYFIKKGGEQIEIQRRQAESNFFDIPSDISIYDSVSVSAFVIGWEGSTETDKSEPFYFDESLMFNCPKTPESSQKLGDEPAIVVSDYSLIFEDHFDRQPGELPDSEKWNSRLPWGPDLIINGEEQHYTDVLLGDTRAPNPFDFDGQSNLIIEAGLNNPAEAAATGQEYYSGVLTTFDKLDMKYGYIETRLKLPAGNDGLWAAFWMLNRWYSPSPDATGPNGKRETEIDWEFVRGPGGQFGGGPYTTECALGAYHYDGGQWKIDANGFAGFNAVTGAFDLPAASQQCDGSGLFTNTNPPSGFDPACLSSGDLSDDFHTFGILWDENSIRYFMDGLQRFSVCDPAIVSQVDMYVIINQAVGGNFPGPANPADYVDGAQMLVDYIRVFQKP